MLNAETKRHIDSARQVLVGKIPDPKSQIEQITNALIYKFMDDMDARAISYGGQPTFFTENLKDYSWSKLMDRSIGAQERMNKYDEALRKFGTAKQLPPLFRTIFKEALLPFKSPETLNLFLNEIAYFDYKNSEELGNAFEYLLSTLGTQGDAGQFRTPRHIIDFIVKVIDPKKTDTILDPACGTAGFLISAFKHIAESHDGVDKNGKPNDEKRLTPQERKKIMENITGYDISPDMVRLSLVNMYLHGSQYGLQNPNIIEYDTLSQTDRWDEKFDVMLANPPFMTPKGGIVPHNKFEITANRAEVLFIDYIKTHLKPNGRAGIIVPEGIIFQSSNSYKELRKLLVEDGLYAVVSLPSGVFNPYSGVKTSILFFDNTISKQTKKMLFIKVSNDGFDLGAQRREHKKDDLPQALEVLKEFKLNPDKKFKDSNFAWVVEKTKILESDDFSLMGERYNLVKDKKTLQKYTQIRLGDLIDQDFGVRITKKDASGTIYPVYGGGGESFRTDSYNRENKLVIARFAMGEKCVRYVSGKFWLMDSGFTYKIKPEQINNITEEYLNIILLSIQDKIYSCARGQAQKNISNNLFNDILISVPSTEVQKEIVSEIESKQSIIDGAKNLIQKVERERADSGYLFEQLDCEWVALSSVAEINPKKSEVKNLKDINVSFVPMNDLPVKTYELQPKEVRRIEDVQGSYTYFKNNDVLLAKVTPCFENGKLAIAQGLENGIGFGSSEIIVVRPSESILSKYIYYFFVQDSFKEDAQRKMTGTGGLKRLPTSLINELKIPVPSIDVQNKIVMTFEGQQSAINANTQLIEVLENQIKNIVNKIFEA